MSRSGICVISLIERVAQEHGESSEQAFTGGDEPGLTRFVSCV